MDYAELNTFLKQLLEAGLASSGLLPKSIAKELGCTEIRLMHWISQPLEIPISKLACIARLLDLEEEIAVALKSYIL